MNPKVNYEEIDLSQTSPSSWYMSFFKFSLWFDVLLYATEIVITFILQRRVTLNSLCCLCFMLPWRRENGKIYWVESLCLSETWKSHWLTSILLFLQWTTFWLRQWPLTIWALMMDMWCLKMTTTVCPDSPGVGHGLCPGDFRPSPLGGITGSWMWHSPPAGFWGSVRTSCLVIPLSVLILMKHFLYVLKRWTIIIVSSPTLHPKFSMSKNSILLNLKITTAYFW